jgi:hypothetical protein
MQMVIATHFVSCKPNCKTPIFLIMKNKLKNSINKGGIYVDMQFNTCLKFKLINLIYEHAR